MEHKTEITGGALAGNQKRIVNLGMNTWRILRKTSGNLILLPRVQIGVSCRREFLQRAVQ